jgi:Memo-like protein
MQTRSDGLKVSNLLNDPSPELVVSRESSSAGLGRCQVTKDDVRSLASTLPPTTWNSFNTYESCCWVPDSGPEIYESIAHADRARVYAITTGEYAQFLRILQDTGNTLCGRHPIRVFMTGLKEVERLAKGQGNELKAGRRRFRFTRYERSNDVESVRDSSVSYASAFAVL